VQIFSFDEPDEQLIETLKRDRVVFKDFRDVVGGDENVRETDRYKNALLRAGYQAQRRLENRNACGFGTDQRACNIEAVFRQ
jgi:hypothetical protein